MDRETVRDFREELPPAAPPPPPPTLSEAAAFLALGDRKLVKEALLLEKLPWFAIGIRRGERVGDAGMGNAATGGREGRGPPPLRLDVK